MIFGEIPTALSASNSDLENILTDTLQTDFNDEQKT